MGKLMRLKTSIVGLPTDLSNLATAITTEAALARTNEGDLTTLTTTAKLSLVGAVNEHDTEIGNLSALSVAASTLVGALNGITAAAGDASTLTTTAKTLVGGIKELDAEMGVLTSLTTVDKATMVGAVNELVSAKMRKDENLNDLDNKATARTNLDVYSKTESDTAINNAKLALGTNFSVADVAARDALADLTVGDVVFVIDDGDTKWASYKVEAVVAGAATFTKIMDQDVYLNSISKEAIKTSYELNPDTNAYTDAEQTKVGFVSITAARDLDKLIQSDELNTSVTLVGAANTDIASSLAVKTYVDNQDALKLAIASNLSDLNNFATSRTNLDVYSKSETDAAIASKANKSMNDSVVIAGGKIVFSKAPIGGVEGVAGGFVRVFGVDAGSPFAYDECEISIDATDITGKTFTVNSNVAGEYDGLTGKGFIIYNPA